MSTITKERIELFIKNPLENGFTRGEQMELARIALASLELGAAPVVPDDAATAIRACLDEFPEGVRDIVEECAAIAENACRATMLHGAKPVSQTYKLNKLSGNSPVTPDGWISCSERMPAQDDWILIYSKHGEYMAGQVQGEYVELSDGTLSWLGNALFWMPLPEPPQEVK